jgi:hypothetical protein
MPTIKTIAGIAAAAAALLAGSVAPAQPDCPPDARIPATANWRTLATANDRARLREWRDAWVEGLEKAAAAGHAATIGGEGALLDPDAAIAFAPPPPGAYRCRTIKLGAKSEGLLDYVAYPGFECRVGAAANGALRFEKVGGSQRPAGRLLADSDRRMIFLGSLVLGDEQRPLDYGHDRERDLAGILERIGDTRWRIAFPRPAFESTIDVIELVPAS